MIARAEDYGKTLMMTRGVHAEPTTFGRIRIPDLATATTAAARERGLVLSCRLHGNVVRTFGPLAINDDDLASGLDILEYATQEVLA